MTQDGPAPRWFSANPSKAWGEKFFLAYSPVWMTFMAFVMGTGLVLRLGEWGFLAVGFAVAAPLVLIPAFIRDERPIGRPWYRTYWFKANLYIAIFNFAANYFGSAYFFDVLGMVYAILAFKKIYIPAMLIALVFYVLVAAVAAVHLLRLWQRLPWGRGGEREERRTSNIEGPTPNPAAAALCNPENDE